MKIKMLLSTIFALINLQSALELDTNSLFEENESTFDKYLDLLASKFVDEIMERNYKKDDAAKSDRKLNLRVSKEVNLKNIKMNKHRINSRERRLYESLTNSFLIGSNDDTTTTNHLSLLMTQQKGMQNMRAVSSWLNEIENYLDELRDAVNRREADFQTGLQRQNNLLGHFNNVGTVSAS